MSDDGNERLIEFAEGVTQRGFALVEFTDRNGEACTLQASSIATEDIVWLGAKDRMHLTRY